MKPPEQDAVHATTAASLKPLATMDGEPVFTEPWQAEALALADTLVKQGVFSAVAWSDTLGEKLQLAAADQQADDALTYYQAVVAALETLLAEQAVLDATEVGQRRKDWEAAYLSTPHGQPVKLRD